MKLSVVVVGRSRSPLREAVEEFQRRASLYWKLEVVEVEAGIGRGGGAPASEIRGAEAERILAQLPDRSELWALTREGRSVSSMELTRTLGRRAIEGAGGVAFVIGGAFGLDEGILERAARRLSLSHMTLPHELARLVLVEQIYRAGTILRNEPYHKGGA